MKQAIFALAKDRLACTGMIVIALYLLIALFAPFIAPYDPQGVLMVDGEIVRLEPPSANFWLGTTSMGRDVFSQIVLGSRIALQVGILSALLVTFIGTTVGLVAGYYGGWVDNVLMRFVDIIYGIPFIPFVVILSALLEPNTWNLILAISLLSWRTVARIVRSQVLSLVQRPFVKAARVAGASDFRIIFYHIFPNVVSLALVEMSFTIGNSIISEASVSFIGFGDPQAVSWGKILNDAFVNGAVRYAPWWVAPPGLAIVFLVLSVFFVSRGLEQIVNPRLRGQR